MERNPIQGSWCVLVHPSARPPRRSVIDSLSANGLKVSPVTNAYAALARLTILARRHHAPTGSLVLSRPDRLDLAGELVRAVASYLPKVRCWQIQDGPDSLRPVSEADLRRWKSVARQAEESLTMGASHTDGRSTGLARGAGPERTDPPSNLLTDEELDLLLAHDPGPHHPSEGARMSEREDGRADG